MILFASLKSSFGGFRQTCRIAYFTISNCFSIRFQFESVHRQGKVELNVKTVQFMQTRAKKEDTDERDTWTRKLNKL